MVLPNLIYKIQVNTLHQEFKKTYAEWNGIAQKFMYDHSESIPEFARIYGTQGLHKELKEYLKGARRFYGNVDANYTMKNSSYKIRNFDNYIPDNFGHCNAHGLWIDLKGRIYSLDDRPNRSGFSSPPLCIDLNGKKNPNIIGVDIFSFVFTQDGRVLPIDDPMAKTVMIDRVEWTLNPQNCILSRGLDCNYYALKDINPKG